MDIARSTTIGFIALAAWSACACGGSQKEPEILTPEQRLNQQIAMAEAQQDEQDEQLSKYDAAQTTEEKESEFDEESAEHEIKRASLNAVDCPNTFEKSQLKGYSPGTATVTLVFQNDGTVKEASISAPYSGTAVGKCVVRAFSTVHIEPFIGEEVEKTTELELGEAKPVDAK